MTPSPGIEPGKHWREARARGERSHNCANPATLLLGEALITLRIFYPKFYILKYHFVLPTVLASGVDYIFMRYCSGYCSRQSRP